MQSTEPNKDNAPIQEPGLESGPGTAPTASPEERLAELEARHAEMADAYLRAKAETENIRRRADEEVA